MHPKTPKWLQDVLDARDLIVRACEGQSRESFTKDDLLKGAEERKFEIIGEALNRINKVDPDTVERIPGFRRIIGFRNILIHGYDDVDYDRVCRTSKTTSHHYAKSCANCSTKPARRHEL